METGTPWNLLAVMALAGVALAWLACRQRGRLTLAARRNRGPAEVVQRLPLTAQHTLHLVRAGQETVWVITYPNGAVLDRRSPFADWLEQANAGGQEVAR
jgi:hypothetical protein